MAEHLTDFLRGGIMVALLGASVYFFKYWQESRDRLFMLFGFAFLIMSVSQVTVFLLGNSGETNPYAYWLRLFAFVLIIIGIIEKNMPAKNQ